MPTVHHVLFAAFDILLIIIILLRIDWLPDIANYIIAFVLAVFAIYEIMT